MLQRCAAPVPVGAAPAAYVTLTVHKAIILLDKLYDIFFTAPRKAHVRFFTKHFIKIEFLDKVCRPVFKEFDEWPEISVVPDPLREKKEKQESPENQTANINQTQQDIVCPRMTRKSRPRIKEKEEKEPKGGYCEMCRAEYADAALHRRSPHHLAFVRDHTNFLALDSLISSGADVASFLDKASNGERRSLRNICNGDSPRAKRRRSGSRDPPNGAHDTRNGLRRADRQYYKVVGVSTKLRSSGGFATRKPSPPPCNGAKPLVVKFRKVRKSELSVLSDEAEQFMFPKRASSVSSTSGDDAPPEPPPERRRLARPAYALKEESSEEDSWPEDKRRRKRRAAPHKRGRRQALARAVKPEVKDEPSPDAPPPDAPPPDAPPAADAPAPAPAQEPPPEPSPLRAEPAERCMKWEDGRLKYTPAVEQLEFAFESVPRSEPWFETFRRQDRDEVAVRNVPKYFALYSKAPKLPYEIGQLPPLKPNCCPLSDLVKRDERPGPSRAYGTRGTKKQRVRKRAAAAAVPSGRPRKSPREHASTLAILGSAGLLRRRADDAKSCASASDDTASDAPPDEARQASERLQRFLADAIEEAAEFDIADEDIAQDAPAPLDAAATAPDVTSLVSECERCDLIRDEIADRARDRRGRLGRPDRTGRPSRRRRYSGDREPSASSAAPSTASDDDADPSEPGPPRSGDDEPPGDDDDASRDRPADADAEAETEADGDSSAASPLGPAGGDSKRSSRSSPDSEDREIRKKRRALQGLLLQPVVRVQRVDPGAARRLRSGEARRGGRGGARARAARLR